MSYYDPQYEGPPPPPTGLVTKVCRRCSAQTVTDGSHCPQCGTSYVKKRPRISKRVVALLAVVVLLAGAAVGLLLKHGHDDHVKAVAAASSSAAAASAAAAESSAAASASSAAKEEAKQRSEARERASRKKQIRYMERTIKKDAIKDVNLGILDGPILKVECDPVGGGSTDDLTAHTGRFSCLAVTKIHHASGTESGYEFSSLMNWDSDRFSWHLGS